jgi:hypothetical protein
VREHAYLVTPKASVWPIDLGRFGPSPNIAETYQNAIVLQRPMTNSDQVHRPPAPIMAHSPVVCQSASKLRVSWGERQDSELSRRGRNGPLAGQLKMQADPQASVAPSAVRRTWRRATKLLRASF